jgi:hypothetical protein
MELDLIPTVILFGVASALAIFCGYMGQRPMDLKRGPRMVPWRFLMLMMVLGALLMGIHLRSLFGLAPPSEFRM